ncbi:hypothetical protein DTL42_00440 [Bremerella cremea]|uniref:Transposase n=1 Tax=Bremerella cremea TaxID=1031537 RepID=A0A368KXK4_9BACT|nr:hypothetical protein DTL42_00440 [Bremerella cremea]
MFEYIETFYNRKRLHQTLGYKSPDQYEAEHAPALAAYNNWPATVRKSWATAGSLLVNAVSLGMAPNFGGPVVRVIRSVDEIDELAGLARIAPRGITPSSLGARSIVEDARLHRMWEDSIRELYGGSGRTGRALREYLNVVEAGGTPTATQARNTFNSVRASFARRVESAAQAGEAFPGYSFERIHHWNWHMADHSFHALDPRQLFPVTQDLHELIHLRTTIRPVEAPLDIYFQPINPLHRMDLDMSYPLAPR